MFPVYIYIYIYINLFIYYVNKNKSIYAKIIKFDNNNYISPK